MKFMWRSLSLASYYEELFDTVHSEYGHAWWYQHTDFPRHDTCVVEAGFPTAIIIPRHITAGHLKCQKEVKRNFKFWSQVTPKFNSLLTLSLATRVNRRMFIAFYPRLPVKGLTQRTTYFVEKFHENSCVNCFSNFANRQTHQSKQNITPPPNRRMWSILPSVQTA